MSRWHFIPSITRIYDIFSSNAYPAPSFSLHQSCVFFLGWFSASFPFLSLCLFSRAPVFTFFPSTLHVVMFAVRGVDVYTLCLTSAGAFVQNIGVLVCSAVWWRMFCFPPGFYLDVHTFARRSRSLSFLRNVAQVCSNAEIVGMECVAQRRWGGGRRTNSFSLTFFPIFFHPCWSSSYPSQHAVDGKLLLFVYFFSYIPLFISTIFHAGIGAFLFGASETQAPRRAVRIFFLVFSDMFGMVHIEV